MSKSSLSAAVLKFINGSNKGSQYMQDMHDYITDPAKTENGVLVTTHGCSKEHPIKDIHSNKKLWQKTHGKQGEHFVISLAPTGAGILPEDVLNTVKEIVATIYPYNMAVIAVHTDSKFIHAHVLLDTVNAVTGRKFSQSPSDLNKVKQKANNILQKHGFALITASANEFVDRTDYSNASGFDFLELDETQFITETEIEEISSFTNSVSLTNTNIYSGWDYPSCDKNEYYGGNIMNNSKYTAFMPQTQAMPVSMPTVEGVPSNTPSVQPSQDIPVSSPTVEAVPTALENVGNSYPTTSVVTGPTFRIKGTPESNLAGLGELVDQTYAYAQEHQRDAANLALAMNQYAQQSGYPANVAVYAGPIFDIDMTGGIYPPLPKYDGNK